MFYPGEEVEPRWVEWGVKNYVSRYNGMFIVVKMDGGTRVWRVD